MKTKCILISLCLFFASAGFAQNRQVETQNRMFEKYAEMNDVTSVSISKAMFRLMGNVSGIDQMAGVNISNLASEIESLQILRTESRTRAEQMRRDFSRLASVHYEELMRVVDGTNRVGIYTIMQGDRIKELMMLVEDGSEFTVIRLEGNFSLQDIQQITNL
jgi:hypothetical protein